MKLDQIRETKASEPRQIPVNDDPDALFAKIRKENQLVSKFVFLYDGQNYIQKSGKLCVPKKSGEKVPVKVLKGLFMQRSKGQVSRISGSTILGILLHHRCCCGVVI